MSAKRSRSAAAIRPPRPSAHEDAATTDENQSRIGSWLGLAWLVGFCFYFYSFTLPNNPQWSRIDVWVRLPDLLPLSQLFTARWFNLIERADLIGVAALILAGAWGTGELALRLLRPPIERRSVEHAFFAMALGLSAVSLMTLLLGLAGLLYRALLIAVLLVNFAAGIFLRVREGRSAERRASRGRQSPGDFHNAADSVRPRLFWIAIAAVMPFLCVMFLGSLSPETDFDVREYHFEGPKEWFQAGRIAFLPHNVYTSFPFFTEMFTLLGMTLHGDWYWGALAGKCVLFTFAPLTALGLFAAGRRWFGPTAGLLAAVVHLTTPWIYRISIIAYAEGGLTFFLFASLFAVMLAIERLRSGNNDARLAVLAGLLAGSGMACKYTGLVQVVAPMGLAIVLAPLIVGGRGFVLGGRGSRRAALANAVAFSLGVAITIGPWLIKNLVQTGNPVYPLAYSVFGGIDWNPEVDARFRAAHGPSGTRTVFNYFNDVIANNDWSSPLCFGLAPLALFARTRRRTALGLWLFVAYLFFTWWALTHRIDRFWVPLIPVASLLAGIGAASRSGALWRWGSGVVIALAVWFNLGFVAGTETFDLCGNNAFLMDRTRAREIAEHSLLGYLNQALPKEAKVLCVGDAEVFEARFPVVYNTVFDASILQEWFAVDAPGTPERDLRLKPADEIRARLHAEGITHVYVNWQEIRRYREPGSYGYTDFVTPSRFDDLVRGGVLRAPQTFAVMSVDGMPDSAIPALQASLPARRKTEDGRAVIITRLIGKISDSDRVNLNAWGSSLVARADGRDVLINAQVFPVQADRLAVDRGASSH